MRTAMMEKIDQNALICRSCVGYRRIFRRSIQTFSIGQFFQVDFVGIGLAVRLIRFGKKSSAKRDDRHCRPGIARHPFGNQFFHDYSPFCLGRAAFGNELAQFGRKIRTKRSRPLRAA
jgi:hypothetical protein